MSVSPRSKSPSPARNAPTARRSSTRYALFGAGIAGIALGIVALYAMGVIHFGSRPLQGAVVTPPQAAPDFELSDQNSQPIRMSSLKGKVVVLTFLYTNCPDACPLITEKLHESIAKLGSDADKTSILAVTVDPTRDTLAQVRAYSTTKDMLQRWHFLIGSPTDLAKVWSAYGVSATSYDSLDAASRATAVAEGGPTPTPLPAKGLVDHASPTFIVDKSGKARVIEDVDFTVDELVENVRILLAE